MSPRHLKPLPRKGAGHWGGVWMAADRNDPLSAHPRRQPRPGIHARIARLFGLRP